MAILKGSESDQIPKSGPAKRGFEYAKRELSTILWVIVLLGVFVSGLLWSPFNSIRRIPPAGAPTASAPAPAGPSEGASMSSPPTFTGLICEYWMFAALIGVLLLMVAGQLGAGLGIPWLFRDPPPRTAFWGALGATLLIAQVWASVYYAELAEMLDLFGPAYFLDETAARSSFWYVDLWTPNGNSNSFGNTGDLLFVVFWCSLPFLILLFLAELLPAPAPGCEEARKGHPWRCFWGIFFGCVLVYSGAKLGALFLHRPLEYVWSGLYPLVDRLECGRFREAILKLETTHEGWNPAAKATIMASYSSFALIVLVFYLAFFFLFYRRISTGFGICLALSYVASAASVLTMLSPTGQAVAILLLAVYLVALNRDPYKYRFPNIGYYPIGFDLRLMPSLNDVSRIPKEGKKLIIVATVDDELHFRIFDSAGNMVVDTDEKKLMEQAQKRFDLRLMYSESDVSSIPTSGTYLVIVANVKDVLYFRIFDADGKVVVDTDETRLTTQAGPIADLKSQLDSLRPPHELTRSEKDRVVTAVTSIVGHTPQKIEQLRQLRKQLGSSWPPRKSTRNEKDSIITAVTSIVEHTLVKLAKLPVTMRGEPESFRLLRSKTVLHAWRDQFGPEEKPKLVLVATTGGAYRAAFWTTVVLDQLGKKLRGFHRHVRLISGASGGMVGAAYYAAAMTPNGPRESVTGLMHKQTNLDSLMPVVRRLVGRDLQMTFWPFPQEHDRGIELEQLWVELNRTFYELSEGERQGWRPSLILSPMIVEHGRRLLISNVDLSGLTQTPPLVTEPYSRPAVEFFRVYPHARESFKLQTAVRMSASFPFASPAVNLPTDPPRRVVDAGYYDNYGVDLAVAWAYENYEELTKLTSGVALIQIRAYPSELDNQAYLALRGEAHRSASAALIAELRTSVEGLTTPFEGAAAARNWSMRFRNATQVRLLKDKFNHPGSDHARRAPGHQFFETFVFENDAEFAMNWFLSESDIAAMRKVIDPSEYKHGLSSTDAYIQKCVTRPEQKAELKKRQDEIHATTRKQKDRLIRWWHGEAAEAGPA